MEAEIKLRRIPMLHNSKINSKFIKADFGNLPEITEEVRRQNSIRVFTGGVRINNSMYRTKSETDKYIIESLKRKLP